MNFIVSVEALFTIVFLAISGVWSYIQGYLIGLSNSSFEHRLNEDEAKALFYLKKIRASEIEGYQALFVVDMACVAGSAMAGIAWSQDAYYTWTSLVITYAVFLILLIFLKTLLHSIGYRQSGTLLIPIAKVLNIVSVPLKPLTLLLEKVSILAEGRKTEDKSRDEFDAMVDSARDEGALDDGEYRLLKNIMSFSEVLASDVMTPRIVVYGCNANSTIAETLAAPELQMYSRFPVWDGQSIDDVIGYVLTRDIFRAALAGKTELALREVMREVYFIPENAPLGKALEQFLKRRQHLFVVVDEYGGVEGLITMEDVMEAILGAEIVDEADRIEDLRELAKTRRDRRISTIQISESNESTNR